MRPQREPFRSRMALCALSPRREKAGEWMKLRFVVADLPYNARSLADFFEPGAPASMREGICQLYPALQADALLRYPQDGRLRAIQDALVPVMRDEDAALRAKCAACQALWDANAADVQAAFESVFGIGLADKLNDLTAYLSLNPVCPRYLDEHRFDCCYLFSAEGALANALHEVAHFVWFLVWHAEFQDDPAGYEHPNVPWLFSELAIDPILRDERLRPFIVNREVADRPAYPGFYEIDGLIERIRAIYGEKPIRAFMRDGLALCAAGSEEMLAHV